MAYERQWKLGEDLAACDNIMDGITFDELIMTVRCNCREITPQTVRAEYLSILQMRLADGEELFARNVKKIIEEVRKGRNQ